MGARAPRVGNADALDFLAHEKAGGHLDLLLARAAAVADGARLNVFGSLGAHAAAMIAEHALVQLQLARASPRSLSAACVPDAAA